MTMPNHLLSDFFGTNDSTVDPRIGFLNLWSRPDRLSRNEEKIFGQIVVDFWTEKNHGVLPDPGAILGARVWLLSTFSGKPWVQLHKYFNYLLD